MGNLCYKDNKFARLLLFKSKALALTTTWSQGWNRAQSLDLEEVREARWNLREAELKKGHMQLNDESNTLEWVQSKVMINSGDQTEVCW